MLAPPPAFADQWDPPAAAQPFRGEATGTVKWVHGSTWWFMLDVDSLAPADGADASTWQAWVDRDQGIKVGLQWAGPNKPKPDQHAWLQSLKPGQKVTIELLPSPQKPKAGVVLASVPGGGEAQAGGGGGGEGGKKHETAMRGKAERGFATRVPEEERGAKIDESTVQHTVEVGFGGQHATLAQAWPTVEKHLKAGEPTKLKLAAGTYRETLGRVDSDNAIRDTLLVIEGAGAGETILTGSDVVPADAWQNLGDGLYATAWEHDWGNYASAWETPRPIGHRSEMVFVDGEALLPVMIEVWDYQITGQLMDHGNRKQSWTYTGFLDPTKTSVLAPGSFGVAEKDENGNKLYVRLPEGKTIGDVQIEVSTRRQIVNFDGGGTMDGAFAKGKNNLVLRGVTFQHYASRTKDFGAQDTLALGQGVENLLIEDCDFLWNSSTGLRVKARQATFRDVEASYNGFGGIGGSLGELVMEDCVTNYNNWRGHMGGMPGWNWGGVKLSDHDGGNQTIRRHEAIGNLTHGFWYDIHPHNVDMEDLVLLANYQTGLDLELAQGPFHVKRMLAAGNRRAQLTVSIVGDLTIEDSILYGSENTTAKIKDAKVPLGPVHIQWYIRGDAHANRRPIVPESFVIKDSVIATPSESAGIFTEHNGYDRSSPYYQAIDQAYRGENNLVYAEAGEPQFTYVDAAFKPHTVDLAGWQKWTREQNVTMASPGFVDPQAYDFTLASDSPLQGRAGELPAKAIDPAKIREAERVEAWVDRGIELNGDGLKDELDEAGIPVPPAID